MPIPILAFCIFMGGILAILGIMLLGIAYEEFREKEWVMGTMVGSMGLFVCGFVATAVWLALAYPSEFQ